MAGEGEQAYVPVQRFQAAMRAISEDMKENEQKILALEAKVAAMESLQKRITTLEQSLQRQISDYHEKERLFYGT